VFIGVHPWLKLFSVTAPALVGICGFVFGRLTMSEPNPSNDYTPLDEALAEYVMRTDRGESVDREEFIAAHPELAEELRAYFADADAVERMVDSAAQGMADPEKDSEPPLKVVRYFGDYELLEELGRGGMGVVYKARQTSLARMVAVKMILSGRLSHGDEVDRFRREAAAAAQLKHRSIVAIHEVGEYEGHHYFSMDYIAGHSLNAIVRQNPLAPRRAARYVKLIAEATECAHRQGILHRDLKSSNVLIDQDDVPVVTDFGLAKQFESDADLTTSGEVLGSPSYMSPEQALGQTKLLRATSDVYSLGATFYELLTGRPPFRADSPAATIYQVVHCEPVSPRMLNPAIDRDVETICLKCLEKGPSRRYPSAQALADDLGRYLEGRPILARPVSRPARLWRWCKRNPMVATLTAAIFALLVLGTAISTSLAIAAHREAVRATLAEEKTSEEAAAREVESLGRSADRGDWRAVLKGLESPLLARYGDPVQRELWRVEALDALNRDKEAAEAVEKLAATEVADRWAGEVLLWQGDVLRLKDEKRSRRLIEEALQHELPPADTAYAKALLAKTVPESTELLRQAVHAQPFHHRANALLATNLVMSGHADEAKSRASAMQCLFPEDPTFPMVLTLAAAFEGDKKAQEQYLQDLGLLLDEEQVRQFRTVLEIAGRGRSLFRSDNELPLSEIISQVPALMANPQLLFQSARGEVSWMKSPPNQVVAALKKSLQALVAWMSGAVLPGQKDVAITTMAEAAEILPIAPYQVIYGQLLADSKRFEEARVVFLKAARSPEFLPGARCQAMAWAGALQLLAATKGGKESASLREDGLSLLEECIRLGGDLPPDRRCFVCEQLLLNNRSRLEVHQLLERAHAKNPTKPDSLLAWSHQIHGNYYRALKLAGEALKANPKDDRAKKVHEECLRLLRADASLKQSLEGQKKER
jgi:tRNA A-37 threonylcarbamoyl transferase component Bud32